MDLSVKAKASLLGALFLIVRVLTFFQLALAFLMFNFFIGFYVL